jgi:hypothetical protein
MSLSALTLAKIEADYKHRIRGVLRMNQLAQHPRYLHLTTVANLTRLDKLSLKQSDFRTTSHVDWARHFNIKVRFS